MKDKATKNEMPKISLLDVFSSDIRKDDDETRFQVSFIIAALLAISVALLVVKIHLPYVPDMFLVDFSVLPVLLSSIAYGPIIGLLLGVVKFILQILFFNADLISGFTGFALDAFFVTASGAVYAIRKYKFFISMEIAFENNEKPKLFRKGLNIFVICIVVALITSILQLIITSTISYRALELFKKAQVDSILVQYQVSMAALKANAPTWFSKLLPDINSVFMGVLIYNVPITFLKYFLSTSFCAIIYNFISPFLHRRKRAFT